MFLPEYMVPSYIVFLDAIPLTTNGKVDRKALPAPRGEDVGPSQPRALPSTPTESTVLAIWKEILGIDAMSTTDNFFELGGSSLQAIKVISRIEDEFEIELSAQQLFDDPTIAGLARAVSEVTGA